VRPRAWTLLLLFVGALAMAGTTLAQGQIDAEEFLARLRRARELTDLRGAQPSPDRIAEVRAALGLPVEISVRGWTVELPADSVLESLSGRSADDFDRARARLQLLEGAVEDAVAREAPAPGQVARALEEAYRGVGQVRPDPFEAILQWIVEAVGALLHRLSTLVGGAGGALAWLLLLIGLAGVGVLLLRRALLVPDRVLADGTARARAAGPTDWARKAEDAVRAGDLREAVRALYLALLASLAGRGLLADAPALTAGETRSAVWRSRPALAPAVVRATESYERVVYGGDEPDERDLEDLRQAAALARRT
jgi:hypothetical protein